MVSGKGKGKAKGKVQSISKTSRAGITFPVGRVARYIRRGRYTSRLGAGAPVYIAAVMEYLCAEVIELAGNAAKDNKRMRITPRFILLAIKNDEELSNFMKDITISEGGVQPRILPQLLPKKKK